MACRARAAGREDVNRLALLLTWIGDYLPDRLGLLPKGRLREAEKALRYYAEGKTDASGHLAKRHLEKWSK